MNIWAINVTTIQLKASHAVENKSFRILFEIGGMKWSRRRNKAATHFLNV